MLDAFYAKEHGQALGARLAGQLTNADFDALRQLVVLFPKIDQVDTYHNNWERVRSRLRFQLAMWLGDASRRDAQRRENVVDALLPVIESIRDRQSWKMYQHLIQTLIAEFKLRV